MQSRNLLNISLVGALALLLAITFWPSDEIKPIRATIIADELSGGQIDNITITRQGYPSIKLYKKEQQWWLQDPSLPAKKILIKELLALLVSESLTQYPLSEIKPEQVGLDTPFLCIKYNEKSACFGDRNPLNQLRYLQYGKHVHIIYDTLSHQLSGSPHDYVSLQLLPEDVHITALTLEDLSLQRHENSWIVTPRPENYSADQTQQLLDHWQHAQALMVAPYQPTESEATLSIALKKQSTISFEMVSSDPELILARPALGVQYHLSEGSLNRLTRLPPTESASED